MRHDDPAAISIDERLDEVASLLATGFPAAEAPHGLPSARRIFIARFRDIRERGKFENPGGIALPSFGKLAPLCRALTERDRQRLEAEMAERLNIAREVADLTAVVAKHDKRE